MKGKMPIEKIKVEIAREFNGTRESLPTIQEERDMLVNHGQNKHVTNACICRRRRYLCLCCSVPNDSGGRDAVAQLCTRNACDTT